MIRLIRWLIWGDTHVHKWEIIERHPIVITKRDLLDGDEKSYKGIFYLQKCSVCGNLKTYETGV